MLTEATLIHLLEPFFDQRSPRFTGFPKTHAAAAANWAYAAATWAAGVVPLTTAYPAAEAAFRSVLEVALPQGRRNALSQAWQALVMPLAAGMAPGWVATPPALPLSLEPVFVLGEGGASNRECLELLARLVTVWMRTGLAVQSGTAATINWT